MDIADITAPNPVAVLAELKAAWWKVEQLRSFEKWTRDLPYISHSFDDLGRIFVVEKPEGFPCGYGTCAGIADQTPEGIPKIVFSRKHAIEYDVLAHELAHVAYKIFDPDSIATWVIVGHGVPDDPYIKALNAWIHWIYQPVVNPYFPGELPRPKILPAGFQSTRIQCGTGLPCASRI